MAGRDIVVVGGSAGGIEAVRDVVAGLPRDFPGTVFVVVHFPGSVTSTLPRILARHSSVPARHAVDQEPIAPGVIYVAPPDCHLTLSDGHIRLTRGPKENGSRPAVDPLFRSAAHTYGVRVVGVVLSGNLNDGTAGLLSIKQRGGLAVVQSLETALYQGMPRSAMEHVDVDHVLAPADIPALLTELAAGPVESPEVRLMSEDLATNDEGDEFAVVDRHVQAGLPSTMSCPNAMGCSGRSRMRNWSSSAVEWATPTPMRPCWRIRPRTWRPHSGWRSGPWRSTRPWPAAWPGARIAGGMRALPPPSRSKPWMPSTTRRLSEASSIPVSEAARTLRRPRRRPGESS
jgi:hypothetical protein